MTNLQIVAAFVIQSLIDLVLAIVFANISAKYARGKKQQEIMSRILLVGNDTQTVAGKSRACYLSSNVQSVDHNDLMFSTSGIALVCQCTCSGKDL